MKLGLVTTLTDPAEVVELVQGAESNGYWGVGLADTAPKHFAALYPTLALALVNSDQVRLGPFFTNPVSQHWSVHASSARTIEAIRPERFFFGIATGDGALLSVGLRPAKLADLEDAVTEFRKNAPLTTSVHMAASGPRSAEAAGRCADAITLGVGLEPSALVAHAERARSARATAGVDRPVEMWTNAVIHPVYSADDVEITRSELGSIANATARFTFEKTFDDKHVPDDFRATISERLAGYDFRFHGLAGKDNPNSHLFDDRPEIQDYLLDRFVIIGTVDQCQERIAHLSAAGKLDGVWLPLSPSPLIDRESMLALTHQVVRGLSGVT